MSIEEKMYKKATEFIKKRFKVGPGGVAVIRTANDKYLISVALENSNQCATLCPEAGAMCEAHKYNIKVTHCICVVRDDENSPFKVLSPCGICQERLAYWGSDVKVGVTTKDNKLKFVELKKLQRYHWTNAYDEDGMKRYSNSELFDVLSKIGKKFNEEDILWAVGASIVLNSYGLISSPNDIDILVNEDDIDEADRILKEMGKKKSSDKTNTYSTKYFYEYVIDDIDVDVMADFCINHKRGTFEYPFDNESISNWIKINNVDIPLTSLEDWYVIYQLIPGRDKKVKIIEDYLLQNGVSNYGLLERALKENLPREVRDNVNSILEKFK